MKRTICSLAALSLFTFSAQTSQAVVGDLFNLTAPGSMSSDITYAHVTVRKSDGSIWTKQIDPTLGIWYTQSQPSGGTTSGPQMATQDGNTYWIVRGPAPGQIWERHTTGTGMTKLGAHLRDAARRDDD
jgi:hypothetical protein